MFRFNTIAFLLLLSLASCGRDRSGKAVPDLSTLKGLEWFEEVLKTEKLQKVKDREQIPERFIAYLQTIDSNFSMAGADDPWMAGCGSPMIPDSSLSTTYRDEKTGITYTIMGYRQKKIPHRKFVYFGSSKNAAALIYLTGGIGVMQHLILFRMDKGRITEHWHGTPQGDISDQKGILKKLKYRSLEEITEYI